MTVLASALPPPELPQAARAVIPTAAATAVAAILLMVLTDFLLAGQEETRPCPVSTTPGVRGRGEGTPGRAQQHE
ncbi:hypothetical protein Srufu_022070 [Streptomyces libani subsp. rufus]|nr:hypothetical protein Srufu_022070 [Streptomyces libani subsp. rufus]